MLVHSSNTAFGAPVFSALIPFRNEAENLAPLLAELCGVLNDLGRDYEVLLVDDASTDSSLSIAQSLARSNPRVRLFHASPHQGQSGALAIGFRAARGQYVITLDADLQNDPADIPRMVEALERFDVVCGVRQQRQDPWLRRASSRVANSIRNWLTDDSIADVGCSLRVFRAELLPRVPVFSGMHRFLPTLLRLAGGRVVQLPVRHRPRHRGTSNYGIGDRAWIGLVDVCGVRWLQRRHVELAAVRELTPQPQPAADADPGHEGRPLPTASEA